MWEEYFDEPTIVGHCAICGEEIFVGNDGYVSHFDNSIYCSDVCLMQYLGIIDVVDDNDCPAEYCENCNEHLTDEYESIMIKEAPYIRFCDLTCCRAYLDINTL